MDCDPDALAIGQDVRLEFRRLQADGDAGILCYGFKQVPIPRFGGILIGLILFAVGFPLMINALKTLGKRALGKELYQPRTESKLVSTGPYAYTRNPIMLAATVLWLGWFFIFRLTFLLIVTVLFMIVVCVGVIQWQEKELTQRFGEEYLRYKATVPRFIPSLKKRLRN